VNPLILCATQPNFFLCYLSFSFRDRNVGGKLESRYNECRHISLHSLKQGAFVHRGFLARSAYEFQLATVHEQWSFERRRRP
jgi:hypothetical protein